MDHSTPHAAAPLSLEDARLQATGLLGKAFEAYRQNDPQTGLGFEQQAFNKLGQKHPGEFCELAMWYMYQLVSVTGGAGISVALGVLRRLRSIKPYDYAWVKRLAFREIELYETAQDQARSGDALATFLRLNTPGSPVAKEIDNQTRQLLGDDVLCCRMRLRRAVMIAVVGTNFIDEATLLMEGARKLLQNAPKTPALSAAVTECALTSAVLWLKSDDRSGAADALFLQAREWADANAGDAYFKTFFADVSWIFKQHVTPSPEETSEEEPTLIPAQSRPPLPVRGESTSAAGV